MAIRSIPDIQIVPARPLASVVPVVTLDKISSKCTTPVELRLERVKEFLMARSLAPRSQRAYEQDLKRFLDWTDCSWEEVTPRQVAQFKKYLMRNDPESNKRVLKDATICRTLTTLKNFYGWMFRCRQLVAGFV